MQDYSKNSAKCLNKTKVAMTVYHINPPIATYCYTEESTKAVRALWSRKKMGVKSKVAEKQFKTDREQHPDSAPRPAAPVLERICKTLDASEHRCPST